MKKENPKKSERKINASSGDFWGADRFSNAEYQEPSAGYRFSLLMF